MVLSIYRKLLKGMNKTSINCFRTPMIVLILLLMLFSMLHSRVRQQMHRINDLAGSVPPAQNK